MCVILEIFFLENEASSESAMPEHILNKQLQKTMKPRHDVSKNADRETKQIEQIKDCGCIAVHNIKPLIETFSMDNRNTLF